MSTAAVEIRGLVKRYGSRTALAGLDLTVPRGPVTALLGPNGAGKTTTVEICCGLRVADAGEVRVLGRDPRRDAHDLRPRLGVMLQSGGVYPGANAAEMLRHVARLHAHPIDPDELLREVGLADTGRTTYRRLSGGQRQLLALALAVVGRPELVFLDEPTAGLDPHARRNTWQLIRQLRADGVTVVLATHLMDEAEALADLVHIVDAGRLVASGTPAELTRGPTGALSFRAPADLSLTDLQLVLPTGCTAGEPQPGLYRVEGDVGPAALAAVTAWCARQNVMPEMLSTGRRTLEDVFLELTARSEP
ncbi:MAG TPA: ABC transporter ATP-binding protein [Pseudonocardiaceae bacterium]|jgi:ABC-2 type transport system ATP-binding protein|nr:ABC transporter ATP-binding protein [Pseudonocardiaceae bacterium]